MDVVLQGTSVDILNRHKGAKHEGQEEDLFQCRECNTQSRINWNMMNHRSEEYGVKVGAKF